MAGRKLVTYVHVNGQVYGPDSDVPADVAERITNPKAWGEQEADKASSESEDSGSAAKKTSKAPAKKTSSSNN